jgi:hypothetical protein
MANKEQMVGQITEGCNRLFLKGEKQLKIKKVWKELHSSACGIRHRTRSDVPLSNPALLISKEGKRVTLRFHPQHGPQQSVAGIKKGFSIALHRPAARPDCHVTWFE